MHLNVLNFDDIFNPEYVITSTDYITSGKSKEKFNDDGLFSERIFGENSDDTPIDRIGWVTFDNFKIISPLFFERLKKIFKNKALNKMLSFEAKTDQTGNLTSSDTTSYFVKPNKDGTYPDVFDPQNIGIPGFIEHFKEIIDLYGNKEVPEYAVVMNAYEKGLLFIDKFPVISAKLRPGMIIKGSKNKNKTNQRKTKTTLKYDDINGLYNFVIQYSNNIKELLKSHSFKSMEELNTKFEEDDLSADDTAYGVYKIVYSLQDTCNQIVLYIINNFLKEKKGVLRKLIASTRVNYSARNVLTPRLKGKINDVELPYLTFLELFRFPLTNMVVKAEGITYNEADEYIQNCKRHFDKKLYGYMKELIKNSHYINEDGEDDGGCAILLNRNPSIAIGSILQLNVAAVKEDFYDLTISVSNNILTNLNADYDGDVLNIFALLTDDQKHYFRTLKPSKLIIDKNNGNFDRGFSLSKDSRYGLEILTKI
jgi:hypothetical protein